MRHILHGGKCNGLMGGGVLALCFKLARFIVIIKLFNYANCTVIYCTTKFMNRIYFVIRFVFFYSYPIRFCWIDNLV